MSETDLIAPGWTSRRVRVNTITLHVVEAGSEDGRPVILLHGFPEFWWAWRKQIQPLADAGFRVIVPDLRGYNLSDAPMGVSAYQIDLLAADVVDLASALGHKRFDLVGHDWGGVVAWWVAARHADRIKRMVIMDAPHPDVLAMQALKHPTQALRSSYAMFFQLPFVPEATLGALDFTGLRTMMAASAKPNAFEPGALDRYVRAWRRPNHFTAMLNYYRALREARSGGSTRNPVPTLVLWGEQDSFLEQHVARASLKQCDDGRLEILPDATHWLHLEQPERVTALIRGHLQPD
jgi:pimeloyl-ACP methyl ester carboxylesterase